jgi:hypothetical protein
MRSSSRGRVVLGSLAFLILTLAVPLPAEADSELVSVAVMGVGPAGNEGIDGTFVFDPLTGTGSDLSFSGSGLISESWAVVGPLAGAPITVSIGNQGYAFNLYPLIGSQSDGLPFEVVLSPTDNFIPAHGGGGGPNFNSIDSWGGSVTATPEPEPSGLLLVGSGLVCLLVVTLRSKRTKTVVAVI